jgi:hypothetical protein
MYRTRVAPPTGLFSQRTSGFQTMDAKAKTMLKALNRKCTIITVM